MHNDTYHLRIAFADGEQKYYATFKESNGIQQEIEISREVYLALDQCRPCPHFFNKSSAITHVGTDFFDGGIFFKGLHRGHEAKNRVVNIRRVDGNAEQVPHCIYNDVPLSSFRFFPPSIPRSSLA